MLKPQHCTAPLLRTAHVWLEPADNPIALLIPVVDTAVELDVEVAFPSCPLLLDPQHRREPLLNMAHE